MKKAFMFSPLCFLTALVWGALTPVQIREVTQEWVSQHNTKLTLKVEDFKLGFKAFHQGMALSSHGKPSFPMSRISTRGAESLGIPTEKDFSNGASVNLTALYRVSAGGASFLIADYTDEYDDVRSSSDIYLKIGLEYHLLFQGKGFRACARIIGLGKDSPVFLEVDEYGGGSQCVRTLYRLKTDAVKNMDQDIYDHVMDLDPNNYVEQALQLNVLLEGFTLYKDMDHDGSLEILNGTRADYPGELKMKLKSTYGLTDNDLGTLSLKTISAYKWDGSKFIDLGDYFL